MFYLFMYIFLSFLFLFNNVFCVFIIITEKDKKEIRRMHYWFALGVFMLSVNVFMVVKTIIELT